MRLVKRCIIERNIVNIIYLYLLLAVKLKRRGDLFLLVTDAAESPVPIALCALCRGLRDPQVLPSPVVVTEMAVAVDPALYSLLALKQRHYVGHH